jgi:hypothetical protein
VSWWLGSASCIATARRAVSTDADSAGRYRRYVREHRRGKAGTGHHPRSPQKKRVSNFDERSHYVVENKGSAKRTKPNKANFRKAKLETQNSKLEAQNR